MRAKVTLCALLLIIVTPLSDSASLISAAHLYQALADNTVEPTQYVIQYSLDIFHPPALPGPPSARFWYGSGTYTQAVTVSPTYDRHSPGKRYVFTHWSGDATGTGTTSDSIPMDGPKTARPNWKIQFEVEIKTIPEGAGTVTPSGGYYDSGTTLRIRAEANRGYAFSSWTNALGQETVSTDAETTINVDHWTVIYANFDTISSDSACSEVHARYS